MSMPPPHADMPTSDRPAPPGREEMSRDRQIVTTIIVVALLIVLIAWNLWQLGVLQALFGF